MDIYATHTHTHKHTNTHTHSLTHTLTHAPNHVLAETRTKARALSLSLSLSHTHTHPYAGIPFSTIKSLTLGAVGTRCTIDIRKRQIRPDAVSGRLLTVSLTRR